MSTWPRNRNGDADAFGNGMHSSGDSELAAVGRAVQTVYVREPDPEITAAHMAAILAEAERVTAAGAHVAGTAPAQSGVATRRALAFRLAAVVASAFVATAGLAIAGVRPPGPFSDVLERIGFDVPGSDEPESDGPAPPTAVTPGEQSGPQGTQHDIGAQQATAQARSSGGSGEQRFEDGVKGGTEAALEGRDTAAEVPGGVATSGPSSSEDEASSPAHPTSPSHSNAVESQALAEDEAGDTDPPAPTGGDRDAGNRPAEPAATPPANTGTGPPEEPGSAGQDAREAAATVAAEQRPAEPPATPADAD